MGLNGSRKPPRHFLHACKCALTYPLCEDIRQADACRCALLFPVCEDVGQSDWTDLQKQCPWDHCKCFCFKISNNYFHVQPSPHSSYPQDSQGALVLRAFRVTGQTADLYYLTKSCRCLGFESKRAQTGQSRQKHSRRARQNICVFPLCSCHTYTCLLQLVGPTVVFYVSSDRYLFACHPLSSPFKDPHIREGAAC